LKIEYSNTNGNEAVMQAMVENLQTRVQLLARQLEIIQNIRQKSNKNQKVLKSI
jgi:tetrahydromethanopterin S-methyltransferase subunit F